MDILFQHLDLSEVTVAQLLDVSRVVLQANGNKTHKLPVDLITDDLTVARDILGEKRAGISKDKFNGMCWTTGGKGAVLWVKPRRNDQDYVTTLCHEVAHALTSNGHDHTWRRAYLILLPFWHHVLCGPIAIPSWSLSYAARACVDRYSNPRQAVKSNRLNETIRHMAAMDRMWRKHKHLVVGLRPLDSASLVTRFRLDDTPVNKFIVPYDPWVAIKTAASRSGE